MFFKSIFKKAKSNNPIPPFHINEFENVEELVNSITSLINLIIEDCQTFERKTGVGIDHVYDKNYSGFGGYRIIYSNGQEKPSIFVSLKRI